jgi:uncharacterized membrane protein YtjA (UPF0391 family)
VLEILIVILLICWLLGYGGVFAIGNAVHVLLVIALVLIVLRLAQGRKIL